uniref:Formylmethanofuran dehydrogenase subunit E n=1 Tax=Acetithermum autotrophicum TaxID=1446466 RepID=H5SQU4_ACEAU|nr:formylmethanofuran dehydrogenase subunit E [Candidatus Acetothermum autotrophicum]
MRMREIDVTNIDALIERAVEFHGHLGPYLICGVRMGLLALRLLGSRGYTGLTVTVETGVTPPVSCLIDGLQIATGCTLGKGNISVLGGGRPRALVRSKDQSVVVELRPEWPEKFAQMDGAVAAQTILRIPEEELLTWRLLPSS